MSSRYSINMSLNELQMLILLIKFLGYIFFCGEESFLRMLVRFLQF